MRKIKFRAWDKKEEKMTVEGLLLTLEQGLRIFDFPDFHVDFADDDRYVLMQYTGLLDKDGIEIYERDVVRIHIKGTYSDDDAIDGQRWYDDDFIGDVYFDEKLGGFVFCSVEWFSYIASHCNKAEVIGNIYENPELLKEKE